MRLRTFTLALLLTVALTVSSWGQSPFRLSDGGSITVSGDQIRIQNRNGSVINTFEELIAGTPATVSITIQGCMRGGTCDAAADSYGTVANSIRSPGFTTVYDYFLVTASWTGGTNVQVDVNATMSLARSGGSGGGGGGTLSASGTPVGGQAAIWTNATTLHGVNTTGSGNVVMSASPTLTGTPTVPTAATITNNNQAASTAYVQANLAGYLTAATAATTYAPLASPALTGVPTAPTAAGGTSTTQLATTAFVQGQGFVTAVTAPVVSVATKTGAVTLVCSDLTNSAGGCTMSTTAAGDISGTLPSVTVTATHLASALPVAQGGTGAATLTGLIKGAGTSPFAAAAAADVVGLFTGCTGTNYLGADGACHAVTGGGNVSNTGTPTTGQIAQFTNATTIAGVTLVPLANGGLNADASSVAAHNVFGNNTGAGAGGAFVRLACADLSNAAASCATDATNATNITTGTLPAAQLPNPSASTLGGVESVAAISHQFLTSISTSGVPAQAQPAFSDLSGSATCAQLPALTGDATTSAGSCTTTVGKVNGVSYGTSPGTNTLPVVTGTNTVTYEAVPNAALANSSVTFNTVAVALGGSGSITLDLIADPNASKTFTFPATTTLTVAGTAPGSVSGAGTAAGTLLTVSGVTGGATTGSATTAGTGSSLSLTAGAGGAGSGGTNAIGGAGGGFTLTAGNGGASGGTAVNSNGGGFTFIPGIAGTGGSGTAGTNGIFLIERNVTTAVTNSPKLQLQGEYQASGTPTFSPNIWTIQDIIAAGTNGATTLTLSQSGSSGTAAVSVPNLINTSTTQFGVVLGGGASAVQTTTAVGATNTVLHGVTGAAPTYSAVLGADMANNTVTGTQLAVVQTRRVCNMSVGADNGSALANGDLGPQGRQCFIPYAATIVEVVVAGDAGTPNVIIGRNRAGSISNIVSSALATASAGGIACSNTGGTTGIDGATTCTNTLQNTGLNAGDYLELVSGTAGGTAKRMSIFVIYTVS